MANILGTSKNILTYPTYISLDTNLARDSAKLSNSRSGSYHCYLLKMPIFWYKKTVIFVHKIVNILLNPLKRFQERKRMLERACSMARKLIFLGNSTFEHLFKLQNEVVTNGSPDENKCTPVIPIKSAKNEHFFNDE